MVLRALSILSILLLCPAAVGAAECPSADVDQIIEVLQRMPSCDSAYKVFDSCSYGSSTDIQFGAVVTAKCESTFLTKLRPWRRKIYDGKHAVCSRDYRNRPGWESFEAKCHATVARRYARIMAPGK